MATTEARASSCTAVHACHTRPAARWVSAPRCRKQSIEETEQAAAQPARRKVGPARAAQRPCSRRQASLHFGELLGVYELPPGWLRVVRPGRALAIRQKVHPRLVLRRLLLAVGVLGVAHVLHGAACAPHTRSLRPPRCSAPPGSPACTPSARHSAHPTQDLHTAAASGHSQACGPRAGAVCLGVAALMPLERRQVQHAPTQEAQCTRRASAGRRRAREHAAGRAGRGGVPEGGISKVPRTQRRAPHLLTARSALAEPLGD
jgi:hypothetical protein